MRSTNDAAPRLGIRPLAIGTVISLSLTAGAPGAGSDSAWHAVERLAHAVGVGLSDAQAQPPDKSDERLKRDIQQTHRALALLHRLHGRDDQRASRGENP